MAYSQLADTMLTMMEEEVEELWTRTVVRMPIITPTTGFCSKSFCWKISPDPWTRPSVMIQLGCCIAYIT